MQISQVLRRINAYILIIVLLVPVTGTFTAYFLQKRELRQEILKKISKLTNRSELSLFRVNASRIYVDLDWKEPREFFFEGHLYDVVHQESAGDTILLYCFKDHAETRLHRQLTMMVSKAIGNDPVRKQNHEKLLTFYKSLFSEPVCQMDLAVPEFIFTGGYCEKKVFYHSPQSAPPAPPPKMDI